MSGNFSPHTFHAGFPHIYPALAFFLPDVLPDLTLDLTDRLYTLRRLEDAIAGERDRVRIRFGWDAALS